MAFVSDDSCECLLSDLDIFEVPPTQTSIQQAAWLEYLPITSIHGTAPIEFEIVGSGQDYIDLQNVLLYVRAKITQHNGNDLAADSTASPVNLFLHSMFSQIDVSLNGTMISSSTSTYPYRAMLETLLSYGSDAKKSQLGAELFYKDDGGRMDETIIDNVGARNPNSGLQQRREFARQSAEFDMIGRPHCDIFFQERYLLNEVNVKIKLVRSNTNFCLMGANSKLTITHAAMYVRKVKLSSAVFLAHAKALETSNAKYPIKRVVCKALSIPNNYMDSNHEKLFSGQLPTRLVIGLVDNRAFNGDRQRNPFNFQHFNLSEIALYLDGQQEYALKPLQVDFNNNLYIRAYNALFAGTCKLNQDEGNCISRIDFANGYALFAYDLTANLADDSHFNLVKTGSVRLALKFSAALAATVTVICYAEFDNLLEIDKHRNVVTDFGV